MTPGKFLFTVCQLGSEAALKQEVARRQPSLRFAFSRPGFVTFRIPDDEAARAAQTKPAGELEFHAAFARTWGFSLGKSAGRDARQSARDFWRTLAERYGTNRLAEFAHLHVWQRGELAGDELPSRGERDPAAVANTKAAAELILRHRPDLGTPWPLALNEHAEPGAWVLDCVLVEPNEWWLGQHRASSPETRWPGGVPNLQAPAHMISRAYLKLLEALLWSELPIRSGDACVEIGSAPGGSCQALLDRGCVVIGIDPAEMDAAVLASPSFTHVRARAKEVDRAVFRGCRWLTADVNLPPTYTLDAVEAVVTDPQVQIEGLVLTLKLTDPALAAELPLFNKRIRSWGYPKVRARQLAFNRQEVCVVAARS